MSRLKEGIEKEISNIFDNIVDFRKNIHMYPELGYKEIETTNRIVNILEKNNVKVYRFENITGAIANIFNNCEKTIAVRVDIDALPIRENTGLSFTSKNKEVMHACGHDVHTSIGVGLAVLLNRFKEDLKVNVKIIFQPAEECSPRGGAKLLIEKGVLSNPKVSEVYGFHVWPSYKIGEIGIKPGAIMAASDRFKIIIKGKNAHAAEPHKGVDAISIGADIINAVEFKLKREINAFEPCIISIGKINSTGRYNIICDHTELEGTIRTLSEDSRKKIQSRLKEIVKGISNSYGADYDIDIINGYNPVLNNEQLTASFIKSAEKILGGENVKTNIKPSLIGEDFSAFCKHKPSLYFHLGCDSKYPLHSDRFFADNETIKVGLRLLGLYIIEEIA
ncbi:M20 metallopeptidase family protein [Maledivibacter halophilus]|uniref:Amidohydrolase n=1 Tax=Maledivibacter halophilus TaxID=36842 RepID=A0A1T5M5W8_9FIRM|nr:M20 family metallopeptidase [Maledivibacter halophilus]SKC83631.1 amidohydrolase [Maledivibacter halophilus]